MCAVKYPLLSKDFLEIVSQNMTEMDVDKFRSMFQSMDKNGDGVVTKQVSGILLNIVLNV